jgi:3-oxoacyl-[acyl-carrier protein] reductase
MSTAIPPSPDAPWSLAGKVAIVTGGSRGIGRSIAIHFARKGISKIAITYLGNVDAAQKTVNECLELGPKQAVALEADALNPSFGPDLISQVLKELDTTTIDTLVNNAVMADTSKIEAISDTTLNGFQVLMQGSVYAPVSLTLALLPYLPAYGGHVINISSMASKQAVPDPSITYAATKAALDAYTRQFAGHFAKEKLATFNSVIVGMTATESWENVKATYPPQFMEAVLQQTTAADRIGVPNDIAYIVGFLASEEGRWVNGSALSANGGIRAMISAMG